MIEKLRRRMRGYWRRAFVIGLPGFFINSAVYTLMQWGVPFLVAAFSVAGGVVLVTAAVLSWQENPPE